MNKTEVKIITVRVLDSVSRGEGEKLLAQHRDWNLLSTVAASHQEHGVIIPIVVYTLEKTFKEYDDNDYRNR